MISIKLSLTPSQACSCSTPATLSIWSLTNWGNWDAQTNSESWFSIIFQKVPFDKVLGKNLFSLSIGKNQESLSFVGNYFRQLLLDELRITSVAQEVNWCVHLQADFSQLLTVWVFRFNFTHLSGFEPKSRISFIYVYTMNLYDFSYSVIIFMRR